jgi:hypothetical protein
MAFRLATSLSVIFFAVLFLTGCQQTVDPINPTLTPRINVESTNTAVVTTTPVDPEKSQTSTAAIVSETTPGPQSTATPFQFPTSPFTSEEQNAAFLELLRTNGHCQGKCIAGIYPDTMNVDQALEVFLAICDIRTGANALDEIFIAKSDPFIVDDARLSLGIVTTTIVYDTIDHVGFSIRGISLGDVSEELWARQKDAWNGFQFETLLQTYGQPSYVGFFFQTDVEPDSPFTGRVILYTISLHYHEFDLQIIQTGHANYDGETVSICPSSDPHDLSMQIPPGRTWSKLEEVYSVTWELLTDSDLEDFTQLFAPSIDGAQCIAVPLKRIIELSQDFR